MERLNRKTVAVIGGAGMVGTALCHMLLRVGADVSVIDNLARGRIRLEGTHNYFCDATSVGELDAVIKQIHPQYVFNLAAHVAGVEYNQNNQLEMYTMNTALQTVPVMVCERNGVPNFLQTSSVCVYGETAQYPAVETFLGSSPVGANLGYSLAKRAGEKAIELSGIKHAVIVRPTNIFGIFDYYDERAHVIPALIKRLFNEMSSKVSINGSPGTIREFIYADDAASAMVVAMLNGKNKQAYNIGTGGETAISIGELVGTLMDVAGIQKDIVWVDKFDGGDSKRCTDNGRINEIGFTHRVTLSDGLVAVVNDYRWRQNNIA